MYNRIITLDLIRLKKVEKKYVERYDFRKLKYTAPNILVKSELLTETKKQAKDGDLEKDLNMLQKSILKVKKVFKA